MLRAPRSFPSAGRVAGPGTGLLVALLLAGAPAASAREVVLRAAPATAPAASDVATPRIVGGSASSISAAPYQVRIRARGDGRPYGASGAFSYSTCGGTLIDAQHVVTAAHCVLNGRTAIPAASFRVDSGFSRYNAASGSGGAPMPLAGDSVQTRDVVAVRRHPRYQVRDGSSGSLAELQDDVAVLTLATPVVGDANTQAIPLADPGASPVGPGRVSGYGLRAEGGAADGLLHVLEIPLIDAAAPVAGGGAGGLNAVYAVTRGTAGSTCQGDSGGPLVQNGRLVGVVSNGPSCGANQSSYYTNVAAPEVRDFILGSDAPPVAPRGGEDVSMRAPAAPRTGDALTCAPGSWSAGAAFAYDFVDSRNGRALQSGPSATYVLAPEALGATVACRARASTAGGTGRTPTTASTAAVAQGPQARLRARLTASRSRLPRGGRVSMRLVVRNTTKVPASTVRSCVRPGPRFVVTRRGGGTPTGGRLCWTTATLRGSTTKRFELRATKRAARGRTRAATVSVTAPFVRSTSAARRLTVRR